MKILETFSNIIKTDDEIQNSFQCYLKLIIYGLLWIVFYLVFFILVDKLYLAIFGVVGIFLCLILSFLGSKLYKVFVYLMHVFVMLYAYLAVTALGWCCGLQYYIFALVALGFFNPFSNRIIMDLLNASELVLFIFLGLTANKNCMLSPTYLNLFHISSIVGSTSIIIYAIKMSGISNSLLVQQLNHQSSTLLSLANQDGLTGLHNRRSMQVILETAWRNSIKTSQPFYVVMCDMDNLKLVNDRMGHDCGDLFLKIFSSILYNNFSDVGTVSRWGGDEFVIVVHPTCQKEQLFMIVDRVVSELKAVDYKKFSMEHSLTVTMGVVSSRYKQSIGSLILAADDCLYKGKKQGRNCVVMEDMNHG